MTDEELELLRLKANLAQNADCKAFKEILLNMVFDYSLSDIEPAELKGMVRLLAKTRDWDKQLDQRIKNIKEMK